MWNLKSRRSLSVEKLLLESSWKNFPLPSYMCIFINCNRIFRFIRGTIFLFSIKITFPSNGNAAYNGSEKVNGKWYCIPYSSRNYYHHFPLAEKVQLYPLKFPYTVYRNSIGCLVSCKRSNNRTIGGPVWRKRRKRELSFLRDEGKERKGERLCNLSNRILYRRQSAERKRVLRL